MTPLADELVAVTGDAHVMASAAALATAEGETTAAGLAAPVEPVVPDDVLAVVPEVVPAVVPDVVAAVPPDPLVEPVAAAPAEPSEAKTVSKPSQPLTLMVSQMTPTPTFKGYDEIAAFGKANIDALLQANSVFTKGVEELSKEFISLTQARAS